MASSSQDQRQNRSAGSGTAETVRDSAAEMGTDMKQEALDRVDKAKRQASDSLHGFAEAIRRAGAELAEQDQGPAAQLLGHAAGGLEQFSSALGRKQFDEMIRDVRRFGRDHPGAFLAGSVLVGMALGRIAQGSVSDTTQSAVTSGDDPRDSTANHLGGGRHES
ncbi:hypothetical protein [Chelativorans sp. M5D2P16]|uniref:hypothetical protein n=1 Tax=Chelativorans sp. M5D2P16 TaxID=3095678 RepID=UPI002ACA58F2|nr:hypothetical protein [Chelativorans sp. M5D2P16]MDZ5700204.1 hypothetical protein [Chelativorans sp. M5D2P16]